MTGPGERLRYALVGTGSEGRHHLSAATRNPGVVVVALVDPDPDAADPLAARLGVRSYRSHLDLPPGSIDVASVAVPNRRLAEVAIDLVSAGIPTIVEKPMATSVSDADRLVAAAAAANVALGVRLQYRSFAANTTVKAAIDSGAIGPLRRVLWVDHTFRPLAYYTRAAWRQSWADTGGGSLLSHHIHHLDLLRWFVGRNPRLVSAAARTVMHPFPLDDIVSATFVYDDDLIVTWQTSYNEPGGSSLRQLSGDDGLIVVDSISHDSLDRPARVRLGRYDRSLTSHLGDDHPAEIPTAWTDLLEPSQGQRRRPRRLAPRRRGQGKRPSAAPWAAWFDDFIDAVQSGRSPAVTGADARANLEVANAIYLSSLTGRTVELPLDQAAYTELDLRLQRGDTAVTATTKRPS